MEIPELQARQADLARRVDRELSILLRLEVAWVVGLSLAAVVEWWRGAWPEGAVFGAAVVVMAWNVRWTWRQRQRGRRGGDEDAR